MKRIPLRLMALILALCLVPAGAWAYDLSFEPVPGSTWTLHIPDDFFTQFAQNTLMTAPPEPTVQPTQQPVCTPAPQSTPTPAPQATCSCTPAPTPSPEPAPQPSCSCGAPILTPTPKPQDTPAPTVQMNAYEQQLFTLVNRERGQNGKPTLTVDPQLCLLARKKSQDMIDGEYFAHRSPTLGSAADMLKAAGVSFTACAENIARYGSVEKAHEGLMSSAGHRANILNSAMTKLGIGIVRDKNGNFYITQLFTR